MKDNDIVQAKTMKGTLYAVAETSHIANNMILNL